MGTPVRAVTAAALRLIFWGASRQRRMLHGLCCLSARHRRSCELLHVVESACQSLLARAPHVERLRWGWSALHACHCRSGKGLQCGGPCRPIRAAAAVRCMRRVMLVR